MSRSPITYKNISAAIRLGKMSLPEGADYCEVAYDKKTHTWSAWYSNMKGETVGLGGQGYDPVGAVEAMLENNLGKFTI